MVFKNKERYWNVWPDGEGWNILVFESFKNSNDDVIFLRNVRGGHFDKKRERKHNNISCADDNNDNRDLKTAADCRNIRERSELQLLCCYNSCKAVANNGEG